ncbi:hypothetical protein [Brevundimonas diminuta]|uniref:hypothetical protein n=1 Tax=Brevundimonas diminuta TaxID=293 RepID=UPI003209019E
MELVGLVEGRIGQDFDGECHLTEEEAHQIAACIREMVEWRPIETAPRDGRYILAMMTGADDRWEHLNGRAFVIRNRSLSADDYDLGWDVYPGFGGVSDRWFSGWLPLPPAPGAEDE